MVLADVKVEGSYLPTGLRTTSGTTLVVVEHRMMATGPTSSTDGASTLSTGLVVEDGSKDVGHDDEESIDVSTGEGWGVN